MKAKAQTHLLEVKRWCTCVWGAHMCVSVCGGQPRVIPQEPAHRPCLLLSPWDPKGEAAWPQLGSSAYLCFHCARITLTTTSDFLCAYWGLNSGPSDYVTNTYFTDKAIS